MSVSVPQRFATLPDGFALPNAGGDVAVWFGAFTYQTITQTPLFTLPAGAVPLDWWLDVGTDFDAGTNNNLLVGITGDDDYFALNVAIGTQGLFRAGATGTVFGRLGVQLANDTPVTVTYAPSGTAATAGAARLFMAFMLRGGY